MLNRKSFLLASTAWAIGGRSALAADAAPRLRIGVVSDIHLERKGLRDVAPMDGWGRCGEPLICGN